MHDIEGPVSFAALLRHYRLAARLTQEELAARCGLGLRTIQNLESGANLPHRGTLRRLTTGLTLVGEALAQFEAAAQLNRRGPRTAELPQLSGDEPAHGVDIVHLVAWRRDDPMDASTASDESPDRSPDNRGRDIPNNLPVQWTSFIGREQALIDVPRFIESNHLVTLTGAGGCGKTRLALEVAREIAAAYPDGVWLVELAPLTDATLVPDTVAAALQVVGGPGQPILATLLSNLRQRRLLLILDNCEHLLDACARLADAVLRSCPDVHIFATSREALGITGEVSWLVPSLSLPPLDQPVSLAVVARCESVRLFVERAMAVQPTLALTEQNAPTITRICRRLDGIPLAIELAARRVKTLALEHIAARLDQRFGLLTLGSRTALPRQQTLAATVDWSYDLLTEPERALFNRLSVFAGAFTFDAVEAVCDGEGAGANVLELLSALVDKSLVVVDIGFQGVESYRLLETLRQYGREKLILTGDAEIFPRKHASYYLGLAEEVEPHLYRPDELVHLARLNLEWDNIVATMRWFLDHGAADEGLRLAAALELPMWYRGIDNTEGRAWRLRLLDIPGEAEPNAARANALLWVESLAWSVGEMADAHRWLGKALAMARHIGDNRVIGWTMHRLSRFGGPDPEQWYGATRWDLADGALRHYRADGDSWGIAVSLAWLGNLAFHQSGLESARHLLAESLATARLTGERHCVAFALRYFGEATSAESESEARAYLVESRRLYRELGDLQGPAYVEYLLGRLECLHGHYVVAREHYCAGLQLFVDWVWLEMVVRKLQGLAIVAMGEQQSERAHRLAGASARLRDAASVDVSSVERAELNRALALARESLSEEEIAAAWAEGQAMTLEEAVAYALADAEAATAKTHR
jgi:predicted ATPase/transcriptional regulator with XRE-family HTH domain